MLWIGLMDLERAFILISYCDIYKHILCKCSVRIAQGIKTKNKVRNHFNFECSTNCRDSRKTLVLFWEPGFTLASW